MSSSGNTFGHLFRVTTFGESHGGAVGCVIDGCPPKIPISAEEIEAELARRATGQSHLVSGRKEEDKVQILSGVFEGLTLGSPICLLVYNTNARPQDYLYLKDKYRPSHADYTYDLKYGIRAWSGGGRTSARETTARVMAGALAKKILREKFGTQILAYVKRVKHLESKIDYREVTFEQIESNPVRCPDIEVAKQIEDLILRTKAEGNSLGGVIECVIRNCPKGIGEPVFDRLEAELAHAMLSLPATKGFEIGSGFAGTYLTGLEHNDEFYRKPDGTIGTRTNNSGGIQGGISNGEDIYFRVAFKPTSTIMKPQKTVNDKGEEILLDQVTGRHDPCVLPRAVPMVEAMAAIVILDHYLRHKAQNL